VVRLGTDDEKETRASGRYEMKKGDRFLLQSAGGGGFGDPKKRDEEALRRDLAEGYVTREAARDIYGREV
jgi:N-methylhydantoinase B